MACPLPSQVRSRPLTVTARPLGADIRPGDVLGCDPSGGWVVGRVGVPFGGTCRAPATLVGRPCGCRRGALLPGEMPRLYIYRQGGGAVRTLYAHLRYHVVRRGIPAQRGTYIPEELWTDPWGHGDQPAGPDDPALDARAVPGLVVIDCTARDRLFLGRLGTGWRANRDTAGESTPDETVTTTWTDDHGIVLVDTVTSGTCRHSARPMT